MCQTLSDERLEGVSLAQRRGLMSELDEMWSDVEKKAEPR